jgi:HEPN domain-containing protein
MEKKSLLKRQSKVYLRIAKRQLKMANALVNAKLYEGVMFHCYHALESASAAGIAQREKQIPFPHKEKITSFIDLYKDAGFIDEFIELSGMLYPHREKSLYSNARSGIITDPTTAYTKKDSLDAVSKVKGIIEKIERMLKKG